MRKIRFLVAALALCAITTSAQATSSSPVSQTINASVVANCVISANAAGADITYDPVGANASSAATQQLTMSYTCTSGVTPTSIVIDQGKWATGSSTAAAPARQMQLTTGTAKLAYNIFSSPSNQTTGTAAVAWGTSNGPTLAAGTGSAQSVTLYVQIPAGQTTVGTGSYQDTVNETVNF